MMTELLNRIDSYLRGESSLQHLEEWLVSNLQNIIDSRNQKAIDLADKIDADLVELAEGLLGESTIRDYLQRYVMDIQTVSIDYGQPSYAHEVFVSSASTTIKAEFPITLVEEYRFQVTFA
jgi:hypothetical protein